MEVEWVKSETSDAENLAMTVVCRARSTRELREAQHILLVEDETLVREVHLRGPAGRRIFRAEVAKCRGGTGRAEGLGWDVTVAAHGRDIAG